MQVDIANQVDWIEAKTAAMLAAAKRSPFFSSVIGDAKHFASQGYVWDVALAISCGYWLSNGVTPFSCPVHRVGNPDSRVFWKI